jgi:hypothetical protein
VRPLAFHGFVEPPSICEAGQAIGTRQQHELLFCRKASPQLTQRAAGRRRPAIASCSPLPRPLDSQR